MASKTSPTFAKRQKETNRQRKQAEKAEERVQRRENKVSNKSVGGEDPDIAGIIPGPQPRLED